MSSMLMQGFQAIRLPSFSQALGILLPVSLRRTHHI